MTDQNLLHHQPAVDDCWNRIGVFGDKSCPRLERHIHCRNCEVYGAAAIALLDRYGLSLIHIFSSMPWASNWVLMGG